MLISNPNADFWTEIDNEEYYTDLVMGIEFSDRDRVSLFIAVCDIDLVQSETIERYTKQLAPDFKGYQISVNSSQLSVTRSISELVEREPYLQSTGKAIISVVGATSLASVKLNADPNKSDRDTFFGYLQWTRESFQNFHFPIILWVSKKIYDLMLSETPDFWSWRNGVFFFKAEPINQSQERLLLENEREIELSSYEFTSLEDLEKLVQRTNQRNSEDPLLPSLYNQLGQLYFDRLQTGKYDNYLTEQKLAIDYFQKAIQLANKYKEFSRENLALSLNYLANLYRFQGRWAEAESRYGEALQIRRTLFSKLPNNDLATSLYNLAGLLSRQRKWSEAELLYEEALQIRRKLFGEQPNNDLATSLNNLGVLYESIGKWSEAESLYEEALQIRRKLFGERPNNDLASSLYNLATLHLSMGRYAQAEALYLEALEISENILGSNHAYTINIQNHLQNLRPELKKLEKPR